MGIISYGDEEVKGDLYIGAGDANTDFSWRLRQDTDAGVRMETRQNGVWKQKGNWDHSFTADNIYIENSGGKFGFFDVDGNKRNLIRPEYTDGVGWVIGNAEGNGTFYSSSNTLLHKHPAGAEIIVEQNDGIIEKPLTAWTEYTLEIVVPFNAVYKQYSIFPVAVTTGTKTRIAIKDITSDTIIYETCPKFTFENFGGGIEVLDLTEVMINLDPPVSFIKGRSYEYSVAYSEDITLYGNATAAKYKVVIQPIDVHDVITMESYDDDLVYNAGDKVWYNESIWVTSHDEVTGPWNSELWFDTLHQAGDVGAETMWLGETIGLSTIGKHLAVRIKDHGMHFYAHNEFNPTTGLTTADTHILDLYTHLPDIIFNADFSSEWTGTLMEFGALTPFDGVSNNIKIKTGSTVPTELIRLQIWEGTDDTGILRSDNVYEASYFTANSDITLTIKGYVEVSKDDNYWFRLSSNTDFSLKTNDALTIPYMAADFSLLRHDNLLQTKPWVDGETWNEGDYYIYDKHIYVCNTTGQQDDTFAANADKWDILGSSGSHLHDRIVSLDSLKNLIVDNDDLVYQDGTTERLKIHGASSIMYGPGQVYFTTVNATDFQVWDGALRFDLNNTASTIYSPNKSSDITVDNGGIDITRNGNLVIACNNINTAVKAPGNPNTKVAMSNVDARIDYDGTKRLDITNAHSKLIASNGSTYLIIKNTKIEHKFKGDIRHLMDTSKSYMAGPDLSQVLKVTDVGAYYNNNEILTDYDKGALNGVAELDASGKVPATQLPGFVDEIIEYASLEALETDDPQEVDKIYLALDTGVMYRYSGTPGSYAEVSASLALGTTSATAYRGDHGLIGYDHALSAHDYSESSHVHDTLISPDTFKDLIIDDIDFKYNDGVADRIWINSTFSALIAQGGDSLVLSDTGLLYNTVQIATVDDLYTHPTGDGNKHVPVNGTISAGKVLTASAVAGLATWETASATDRIISPDTLTSLIISNTDLLYGGVAIATISDLITDHVDLSNIGTNTHTEIDTHIANVSNPHSVTENVTHTGDATGATVLTLADTAVTPGDYTTADITIDSKGRITAAASGTAGVVGDMATATFYDGTGGQSITDTYSIINIDTTLTNNATSIYSLATNQITIAEAGYYSISYSVGAEDNSTTTRGSLEVVMQLDTGAGMANITGSQTNAYWRNVNGNGSTAVKTINIHLDADDIIQLRAKDDGNGIITFINTSSISLIQLKGTKGDTGVAGPPGGVTDHTLLSNIGTNTHAEVDTHIADSTVHFTEDPNWDTSFGWGDHSGLYSLLNHTHLIADITDFTDNSTNWNTAYGWGDHSNLYSLSSHTHETLISPDTLKDLILTNDDLIYHDGTRNRVTINDILVDFKSPDGVTAFQIDNDGSYLLSGGVIRLDVTGTYSTLAAPLNAHRLKVDADGAYYDEVEIATVDDLHIIYSHPTNDGNVHVPANSTTNDGKVLTASDVAGIYTWETPSGGSGSGDVTGPTSATDNHLVRWNGTTGKIIQDNSPVVVSDAGIMLGVTSMTIDNILIDGNTIEGFGTNQTLFLSGSGTGSVILGGTIIADNNGYLTAINKLEVDLIKIDGAVISTTGTNANLYLFPNGTGSVWCQSNLVVDDKVGIGTSSPTSALHIRADGNSLRLQRIAGAGAQYLSFYKENGTTRRAWMGFGSSGNEEILSMYNDYAGGTLVLSAKVSSALAINGANKVYATTGATGLASPNNSRWLQMTNAVMGVSHAWTIGSDAKLKTKVETIGNEAISFIDNLRPVEYERIDTPDKKELGFIAQEVEEIQISDMVSTSKDDIKGISYTEVIAPLVKYVQELKREIEELKLKIQ